MELGLQWEEISGSLLGGWERAGKNASNGRITEIKGLRQKRAESKKAGKPGAEGPCQETERAWRRHDSECGAGGGDLVLLIKKNH